MGIMYKVILIQNRKINSAGKVHENLNKYHKVNKEHSLISILIRASILLKLKYRMIKK
jgi:hypothetical protein